MGRIGCELFTLAGHILPSYTPVITAYLPTLQEIIRVILIRMVMMLFSFLF